MRRRIVFALFLVLALVGISAAYAGWTARGRYEPTSITWDGVRYDIVKRREGQAVFHDFVREGRVAQSLVGSTDLVCDDPYSLVADVDRDGRDDVYHHHCGGHGYVKHLPATRGLEYVNLGSVEIDDAPGLQTFWVSEIRSWRGLRLLVGGSVAALVGLLGVLAASLASSARRA